MSNFLIKTAETEVKPDAKGNDYKTISYTEAVMMKTPFGEIAKPASQCKTTRKNSFKESYLDGKMELGYGEPIFDPKNPQAGGIFMGAIVARPVAEYDIPSNDGSIRTVDTYSTVVFGDTDSPAFESLVKAAFKSAGHEIKETILPVVKTEEFDPATAGSM